MVLTDCEQNRPSREGVFEVNDSDPSDTMYMMVPEHPLPNFHTTANLAQYSVSIYVITFLSNY